MAKLSLNDPIDLITLDLAFPVGGTGTAEGFEILSGTGWKLEIALTDTDIATDAVLSQDTGGGFQPRVEITDIDRPVVFPIGGNIQSILHLLLDRKDLLVGTDGDDGLSGYDGADRIRGGAGDDVLAGDAGNDRLFGARGLDTLYGMRGDDLLDGGGANDRLFGNKGDDTLDGGRGHDILNGGDGDDVLTGGEGSDHFNFRTGYGNDTITDFEAGVDRIRIFKGAESLDDLTFTRSGNDVLVWFSDVEITVQNVSVADLKDVDNFLF